MKIEIDANELRDIILTILETTSLKQGEAIMTQLEKLNEAIADITASTTLADSLVGIINFLRKQIAEEMAKEKVSPELQAKIEEIFSAAETNRAKLADAAMTNVPPPVDGGLNPV